MDLILLEYLCKGGLINVIVHSCKFDHSIFFSNAVRVEYAPGRGRYTVAGSIKNFIRTFLHIQGESSV